MPGSADARTAFGAAHGLGEQAAVAARQQADLDPPSGGAGSYGRHTMRRTLAWTLCAAGLIAYNWWLLVPLRPGLMRSPDELFSNLEVTGQPYAAAMQHADFAAGLLLVAAFWAVGYGNRAGRREWLAMLGFAVSGALGGLFPEVCADGINAACRRMELHFQLPASHYIHMVVGIFEFFFITAALALAARRTRGQRSRPAVVYRGLAWAAVVAYPLLGLAYLVNRLGGVMEAVFFVGFTVMVVAQLAERSSALRRQAVAERRQVSTYCRV